MAYAIKDIIISIKKNFTITSTILNFPRLRLLMKSADTLAFKKKALGMAKNATKAIPISTSSIVPVTGELKKRLPKTSQKVNIARNNKTIPEAVAE